MAVPSPVGDVKIVSPISTFVLNTFTFTLIEQERIFFPRNYKHVVTPIEITGLNDPPPFLSGLPLVLGSS